MVRRMEHIYQEKGETWPQVLKYNYEKYGDRRRAMRHKHYGIWQPYTWKDYYLNVKYFALGLLSLGFESGDKLIIIGDNAPQWYYAELAAQANHGVSVGLYADLTPQEIKFFIEDSEAEFAVVEDQEQVDKLLQIKDELPLLKKVIYWNYKGLSNYHEPLLIGYREVLQAGRRYEEEYPRLFEQNVETGKAEDPCAIVYTSGTTRSKPLGAVHTFKSMRTNVEYYLALDPWNETDNILPHLPPVWISEQWFGIGCHLLSACALNLAESPETQQRDMKETKPSIVIHGARTWESQAAMVRARILSADPVKRFFSQLLMPLGYELADLKFQKKKPSFSSKLLYSLADLVLFRPIKRSLGLSNARICYSHGAIISPEAMRFYHALNLPLKSLYGTTEGGAITGTRNDDIRLDTVGPAHQGVEIKITEKGEIIYRHPGIFMGYYKNLTKTEEVLKDGWFYSGDSGRMGEEGHLLFMDRLKDIIYLSNGNKLAPQWIESRLRSSPYIKDAWIISDPEKAYASAIIIINYDHVGKWAGQRRMAYHTFAELSQKAEVYDLIEQEIDRINQTLSPQMRIKKFVLFHKEFDPEEGELTRNRKLKRTFLKERYHKIIQAIYHDQSEIQIETQIPYQDERTGPKKTVLMIKSIKRDRL